MKMLPLAAVLLCQPFAAVAQQAAEPQLASSASNPEIVCKRFAEPGTLIKKRKICLTRDQWSHLSEAAQNNVVHHQFNNQGGADGCKPGAPGC